MLKAQRHAAIRERAASAIRDLYHNATPSYPRLDGEAAEHFDTWFPDTAQFEIEYIQDGGAYGSNYAKTLRAECNAGRYKSKAAQDFYVRVHMRRMREDQAQNAWERISEFGTLYTYGRGGRTLAPDKLARDRGGSGFSIREDYAADLPIADVVDLIRVVESFNSYVTAWCKSVPDQWKEYWADYTAELDRELQPTE